MEERKKAITVEARVQADIDKVWNCWNTPEDVKQWNNASPDWHTPRAENDLREGGTFNYTMAARDGSFSFDFGGTYDKVERPHLLSYTMTDGRKVEVQFTEKDGGTHVSETFDPESENPLDMQRQGWQAILDNFKQYVEGK